jgi:hypothetical protein
MLYLQLLVTTMPHYHHLYNAVQEMYSKYELEIEELEEINVHVSYIQGELFRLELTEDNHIHNDKTNIAYRPRHSSNKQPSSSRPFSNNPRRHRHQTNFTLQSTKFKKMKCWGCGYNHHLRDCPTTSNEDKQRLWEEHRTNLANNTNKSTNRCISSNSANIATTNCEHTKHSANTATDAQPPTTSAKPTKPKQTKLEMSRRKGIRGLAYATIHQENMATTPENLPIPTSGKDHNTDLPIHHTGNPFIYTRNYPAGPTQFAQAQVEEISDEDLTPVDDDVPTLGEIIEHREKIKPSNYVSSLSTTSTHIGHASQISTTTIRKPQDVTWKTTT